MVAENGAQRLTFTPTETAGGALSYVFTATISAATPQGSWTFAPVTLVDQAGNSGTVTPTGPRTFTVDSVTPTISLVTITPRAAKAGTDVRVAFSTSEAIAAPNVVIDDLPLTRESASNGNRSFVFVRRIVGTETEGLAPITISVADSAGNVGIAGAAVTLDFDAPGIISASASPTVARANSSITYTVTADENLSTAPVLTIGGGVVPFAFQTGTSFIYTAAVTTQTSGPRTVQIGLTDVAGNTATVAGGGFSIDSTVPTFSSFTTTPRVSAVIGRNTVTTTFTLSENVGAGLDVKVGGRAASCTGAGLAFTCTLTAVVGDGEGAKSVTAQATDAAGNVGVASGVVEFDFTAPTLVASAVRLQGAVANPLPVVTTAKIGTSVEVTATLNERIVAPVLTATPDFGAFTATDTNPTFVFRTTVSSAVNGNASLSFVATDLAGNTTTLTLPTVPLDNVVPAAPTVNVADRITFTRAPWGTNSSPASIFKLDGLAGSIEANSVVAAYAGGSIASGEIARVVASASGAFSLPLNTADRAEIFVAAIDGAGNIGALAKVRDVAWTATMRDKVVGSTVENPHTFEARGISERAREQLNAVERPEKVANLDGQVDAVAGVPTFVEVVPEGANNKFAFDPYRDVALMPGGPTGMLEWDGTHWTAVRVRDPENDGQPDLTRSFEVVYDLERAELVLVGGFEGQQTWTYNGVSWRLADSGDQFGQDSPQGRTLMALGWDDVAREVVMFGGEEVVTQGDSCLDSQNECRGDTWTWNGGDWLDVSVNNVGPSRRQGPAMTWDSNRQALVLFGGAVGNSGSNAVYLNDTWLWNGSWTRLVTPPAGTPPGRERARLAFHAALNDTVMYGGNRSGTDLATAFILQGNSWTSLDLGAALAPPATSNHDLEYDLARDKLLLVSDDGTWTRTAAGWRRESVLLNGLPSAREDAAVAWDPIGKRTLMYGGEELVTGPPSSLCDGSGFTPRCGDYWAFDGARWNPLSLGGTTPGPRSGAGLVVDEVTGNAFLYGGSVKSAPCDQTSPSSNVCDGLYRFSGATSARMAPATRPPGRVHSAVVFDPVKRRVIVHGGRTSLSGGPLSDTWAYTITTNSWQQLCTTPACIATSPGPRFHHSMAWDTNRNVAVLFGGTFGTGTNAQNIYEFSPTTDAWTRRVQSGEIPPGVRINPGLAYDRDRQRTVLFGQPLNDECFFRGVVICDLYEFNNATGAWLKIEDLNRGSDERPSPRKSVGMVYDPIRREHQIIGGEDLLDFETWRYVSSAAARPGQMFVVDFDAARAAAATVRSVQISWRAAGSKAGFALTTTRDGRRVLLGATALKTQETLTSTLTTDLASLLTPSNEFVFWADAQQGAGVDVASILATDAVEATVVYRLP